MMFLTTLQQDVYVFLCLRPCLRLWLCKYANLNLQRSTTSAAQEWWSWPAHCQCISDRKNRQCHIWERGHVAMDTWALLIKLWGRKKNTTTKTLERTKSKLFRSANGESFWNGEICQHIEIFFYVLTEGFPAPAPLLTNIHIIVT